jgi:hypothetical protein
VCAASQVDIAGMRKSGASRLCHASSSGGIAVTLAPAGISLVAGV